jgi:hypothetical protein
MGSRKDSDAKLLEDIARRGNGRIYFAEDVHSLPRIFSQETIAVARSSFVDVPAALLFGPDLSLLGKLPQGGAPRVGGYNLTYLKPQASVGLTSDDANKAPVVAFWQRGAGRAVAITAEVDGSYTGELKNWTGMRALLEDAVRWTLPAQMGDIDAVPRSRVQGDDLHVTLDFDPTSPPGNATLVMLSGDAHARPVEIPMSWEDEDRMGAHFKLPGSGVYHPIVRVRGRVYRAPAVTLSYAPEFEHGSSREGKELLAALAKTSGGVERLAMAGLFAEQAESEAKIAVAPWLVGLTVALLLVEVFVRRFLAGRSVRARRQRAIPEPAVVVASAAAAPSSPAPRIEAPPPRANEARPEEPAPAPPAPLPRGVDTALDHARDRARKRTYR